VEPLKIAGCDVSAERGDFDGFIDESRHALMLPEKIAGTFKSHGVFTAAKMLSYLESFPSAIAAELDWTVPEVVRGLRTLRTKLKGHVDDALLEPSRPGRFSYGAMNPATYKRNRG